MVSAGMLMALDDLGFTPAVDKIFGSSAGGINAALYLHGDLRRAESLYYSLANTKGFVDIWRPLRGKEVVDMRYAVNEVRKGGLSIDPNRISETGIELHIAITDVDNVALRLVSDFESADDLAAALVAGCWLPMLAGPPCIYRDYRALDGGLLLEHPARAAVESGCTHVLVLSTRYPRARVRLEPWRYVVREYLRSLNPALADAFWVQSCRTVNYRDEITRGNADDSKGPLMLTVTPRPGWTELPRLETGLRAFQNAMKEGYDSLGSELAPGSARLNFFSIEEAVSQPRRYRTASPNMA
jgi:predicted patatin/cPLA2 family phospholipase